MIIAIAAIVKYVRNCHLLETIEVSLSVGRRDSRDPLLIQGTKTGIWLSARPTPEIWHSLLGMKVGTTNHWSILCCQLESSGLYLS